VKREAEEDLGALNLTEFAPMSKLYAGFLVIASMLALSGPSPTSFEFSSPSEPTPNKRSGVDVL
jgi:hypothetical protein